MGDLIESAGPEPVKADIPQSPRCDVFFSLKMESYISFLYMEVVVTDLLLRTWTRSPRYFSLYLQFTMFLI